MSTETVPPPPVLPDAAINAESIPDAKPKKSWRRKYRKMRAKFEDTMNASNQLILDEWKAQALSRRLQEQNDQILELLLSMNDTARLPAPLRFDLRSLAEIEAADPALPADPNPEIIQQKLRELREDLAAGVITAEDYTRRTERLHNSQVQPMRSLASLEAKVAHTTEAPEPPVDGVDLSETAPGYMTPAHEEEYLLAMDMAIADPSYNPNAHDCRPLRIVAAHPPPSEKDLTVRNPSSVYNWLRKNQPQVFLQDKDPQHPETMSEKSAPKASNAGGRNKRQSAAHGTPGPKTDHEEDDTVPETSKSRKSKGGEDDGAYRPKGGSSRPANKRKRDDGDVATKGSRKKNRPSTGVATG